MMARRHLDVATLGELLRRELNRDELRSAAWHLYKCRRCRGRLRRMDRTGDEVLQRLFADVEPMDVSRRADYSAAFGAATRSLLRRHQRLVKGDETTAQRRLEHLLARPAEQRPRAMEEDPSLQVWGVAEGLLERCRQGWGSDPAAAEALARLALRAVAGADVRPELRADLTARAWAFIGNCRRVGGDLPAAAEAFAAAHEAVGAGSGDPVEKARLLDLEASVLRAQRRFAEASATLQRSIHLYRAAGDRLGEARALVKQGVTLSVAGRLDEAVAVGRRAVESLDLEADPRLYLIARYNLLTDLHEVGRDDEVLAQIDTVRREFDRHAEDGDRVRLRWFEGVLARDLGQLDEAEEILSSVRRRYVDAGVAYNAAVVSLDLAVVLLEQGRTAETRDLARETLPIFESQEVQREAWAAFLLFQQAAVAETITAAVVRQAARAVRRGEGIQVPRDAPTPS